MAHALSNLQSSLTIYSVQYMWTLSNSVYFMQLSTSSVTHYTDFPQLGGFRCFPSPDILADFIHILLVFTSFSWGRSFTPYLWLIHAKLSWTSARIFPGKSWRNNAHLSSLVHMPLLISCLNLAAWTLTVTVNSNWLQTLFLTITALQSNHSPMEKQR